MEGMLSDMRAMALRTLISDDEDTPTGVKLLAISFIHVCAENEVYRQITGTEPPAPAELDISEASPAEATGPEYLGAEDEPTE